MNDKEKAFWDWFQIGVDNDWVTPPFCETHDGGFEFQTDEERQEWEDGGDPCMTVTRVKFLG
jgi:hypothetical protein